MARLLTSGFEWNDFTADGYTTVVGSPALTTSNVRTGTYAASLPGTIQWAFTGAAATGYFLRAYFFTDATSFSSNGLLWFLDGVNTVIASMWVNADGTVSVGYAGTGSTGVGTTTIASTASALTAGQHRFELYVKIAVGAADEVTGKLDGVQVAAGTGLTISDSAPAAFRLRSTGIAASTCDDVALNDSTGSSHNTFPGDGSIVLLKPISDNAVGAGWVNDANSATNIFTAVSQTPPKGTVNSTTTGGTHQIADATTGAVEAYDANLTTYTTAGIGASDTINFAQPFVATGAPVSTSAKTGALGIVSNPVIGTVNFADGGAVDAFWSGVTATVYPTGWKWSPGGTVNNPSVTLGTSPVMRVVQIDSSTRVAMCCAMGLYVDYTPAATTFTPVLTMAPRIPTRRS